MNATITQCPECGAQVEIDLEGLEEDDCVVCDQCDEALTVISVSPLELAADEEDDDDQEDIDDAFLGDDEADDEEDDEFFDDEDDED